MKKIILTLLTLAMILSFSACKKEETKATNTPKNTTSKSIGLEGSLESILEKIYDKAEVSDSFKEFMGEGLQVTEITADRCAYYLGKDGINYEEAISSEPVISSAYELDLVRVKDGADVEQIKKDIKDNINPQKWVCVGVNPDNVVVDNIGDVIIVIMSDAEGKALHEAFLSLKG